MLIIQNVLLKWFDEWQKVYKKRSKWRDGSRNGVVGEVWLGRGHWDPKLTQSDNGRRQPACQVSPPSVQPFCRNSRFCPIRGKNAGWVILGENLGKKGLTAINLD